MKQPCNLENEITLRETRGYILVEKEPNRAVLIKCVKPSKFKIALFALLSIFIWIFAVRLYYFVKGTTYRLELNYDGKTVNERLYISS